ncbi:unnamed protein product [Bursaphelenchus xylophilus]|uniref:(pine wood nematode) hypothetical protein n=1 Tax=Bursaphelenchus xylophilus TaxID=6326 RepID=A0A1I7SCG3_BURXY|nr:unnamed protein product [Bursaphelenchus xylophilus]CAG9094156.1 unnamed protein product [Bursaphelenchus xylophilus]
MEDETLADLYDVLVLLEKAFTIVTVAAVVLSVYFVQRVIKCKRIHVNFKLVLCCTAISFLLVPFFHRCIQILLFASERVTRRFYVNWICVVFSMLNQIFAISSTACMVMLALVQHLAARWVRTYEEKSMSIGVCLIAFTLIYAVTISIIVNYYYLRGYDFENSRDNCDPIAYNWQLAGLFFLGSMVICMGASMWLMQIRKYNTRQRRAEFVTLSARYQQIDNENSAVSITATVVGYMTYSALGLLGAVARYLIVKRFGEHSAWNQVTVGYGYTLVEIYALFHMACFIRYNRGMRRLVDRDLDRLFGSKTPKWCSVVDVSHPSLNQVEETDVYFRRLQDSWR